MPQPPDWKRVLETGIHFTELRRSQARQVASDLVAQGQLARDQLGAAVDELVDISRRRSEELRAVVSTEVQRQLSVIGLATQRDLDALERRLTGRASSRKPAGSSRTPAKKRPAQKKATSKAPAKKKATKVPVKKKATKKAAAKKGTAKRTVRSSAAKRGARKVVARKPAAKRAR